VRKDQQYKKAKQVKRGTGVVQKKKAPELNIFYGFFILVYALITVITPNLNTFDSNGPKFLALAMLNLLAFSFLLTRRELRNSDDGFFLFFRNRIGVAYALLLLLSLLSFFKALNIYESILHFSKIFTVFSAAYLVSIILRAEKRLVMVLSIAMTLLLIFDSLTVFYHVSKFILAGADPVAYNIKSVYSNKNILSAAIFVKIPFALWLFSFERKRLKILGVIAMSVAFVATLYMSSRSFYLGMGFLLMVYTAFIAIRFYRRKAKRHLIMLGSGVGIMIIFVFVLFTQAGRSLIPAPIQNNIVFRYLGSVDLVSRLGSITAPGGGGRTDSWIRSFRLIKENPVLGVGCGNWKIAILKYENPIKPDYVYQYKNHNDFIEIPTESGLISGLLFISIFVFAWANFLKLFLRKNAPEESYMFLFLPAFGLLAYSFDAFFNFPADRPEIGSLFAMYVGAAVAFSTIRQPAAGSAPSNIPPPEIPVPRPASRVPTFLSRVPTFLSRIPTFLSRIPHPASRFSIPLTLFYIAILLASIAILIVNFNSLKLQRKAKEDLMREQIAEPTEMFIQGYPLFPQVSMEAEPIVVSKARYLFRDKQYEEALALLKADRSSPYDTRPEFFIAQAYFNLGNYDSSLVYNYKVYALKPLFFNNILNICRILEMQKRYPEAIGLVETYTRQSPQKEDGYLFGAALSENGGFLDKAVALLDSGKKYLPDNAEIVKQKSLLSVKTKIKPYEALYNKAQQAYVNKNYKEALQYFSEFISKEPNLTAAYELRAYCYFFLKEYKRSLADVARVFADSAQNGGVYNLRGVNLHMLGDDASACHDFEEAVKLGDKDAVPNYEQFCKKKSIVN